MTIELWGGVECTVNRVGDTYFDQLDRNGHLSRPDDIDAFADLGLTGLRVPIIWERCLESFDDFDPMLQRVKERGLRAIAGLCHHGSGPRHTSLLHPTFATELAEYAGRVARAYPWIIDYTPVNEPLTTARFSALYGHWYPHARETGLFLRALVNETVATILSMRAINEVDPWARLVQTEDLALTHSTRHLKYQADFENVRRFLSLDLLCGMVDRAHPMYFYMLRHGIGQHELEWFQENARRPDVIGINYYFTSERYIDEDVSKYPKWSHGGNGRHTYADVHVGMVEGSGMMGHAHALETVYNRYKIPVALTEVHAGCGIEDQMRWLWSAWQGCHDANAEVVALTSWALLGSFDWNQLVTALGDHYEPGAFDIRSGKREPTNVASMLQALAKWGHYKHNYLYEKGWWHRTCVTGA
jgi:dTDP-4-dehydrorhamnose reductase